MPELLTNAFFAAWSKTRTFRSFIIELAEGLSGYDLSTLKYAIKDSIPEGNMKRLDGPLAFFSELEDRGMVGPGKLDKLRNLLKGIHRPKLIALVDEFDDSGSAFPLKAKAQNYLEVDGYRVAVKDGRHFETTDGEFVEVQGGTCYKLAITNLNNHICVCKVSIDGCEMFPGEFVLNPKGERTIEQLYKEHKKVKFFNAADTPEESEMSKWRRSLLRLVNVVFIPERADMKITCIAKGAATQVLSCSYETTDCNFYESVSDSFGAANATIIVNGWKPLGKRGKKLTEYGIQDGSQVEVNIGGKGGVSFSAKPSSETRVASKKDAKWRAGTSTPEDESQQKFVMRQTFPLEPTLAVSLNLRLVAREDVRCLPSTGECTPLARATLIPPPVPV